MSLETYITLQEASQLYSLDPELLTRCLSDGTIRGGKFNGTFVLSDKDAGRVANQQSTKEELRSKVAHLEGRAISMSSAARKYGLGQPSISRWANAGYIRILHQGGPGRATLVDESDVAYAASLANVRNAGQGKEVFVPEYLPDWF